jgi:hypothetical protein
MERGRLRFINAELNRRNIGLWIHVAQNRPSTTYGLFVVSGRRSGRESSARNRVITASPPLPPERLRGTDSAGHNGSPSARPTSARSDRWPLTSRPKGQLAQPLREGFPVALGGIFDLLQLLGTKPGGNGFGTQTRSRSIGWRRRRWRNAGSGTDVGDMQG